MPASSESASSREAVSGWRLAVGEMPQDMASDYSLVKSTDSWPSEIHRLKCDLGALPQPGTGLRDQLVVSAGGDFGLDRVSGNALGLCNPAIDQQAMLAG